MTAEDKHVPHGTRFKYLSGDSESFSFVWHKASMKLWDPVVLEQPFWSCQCGEMDRGQGKRLEKQKKQTAANSVVDSLQQVLGSGSRRISHSSCVLIIQVNQGLQDQNEPVALFFFSCLAFSFLFFSIFLFFLMSCQQLCSLTIQVFF